MTEPITETKSPELVVPKCDPKGLFHTSDVIPGYLWSYWHPTHTMREVIAEGYFDPIRQDIRHGQWSAFPRGVGAKIDCYLGDPRKGTTQLRVEVIDAPATEHGGPVRVARGPWKKFDPSPYDDDELTGRKPTKKEQEKAA